MFVRGLAAGGARLAHARWKLASERIGFRAIIMVKCGSVGFVHHPVRGLTHHSARETKTGTPSRLEELAENYRREAQVCRRMAGLADGSQKEEWLRPSAEWIRLAKEADAIWWLT
jgi:hypothetical protein